MEIQASSIAEFTEDGIKYYKLEAGNTFHLYIRIYDFQYDNVQYTISSEIEYELQNFERYGGGPYNQINFDLEIPTTESMMGENRITFEVSDDGIPSMSQTVEFLFTVLPVRDEILITKGINGDHNLIIYGYKNFDQMKKFYDFATISEFICRGNGGGFNRTTYVSIGGHRGNTKKKMVVTYGPVIESATYPNVVNVYRWGESFRMIDHTFSAFPVGDTLPVHYNGGEIRSAIGNFLGNMNHHQIALAQGIGGNQVVRIYENPNNVRPYCWAVAGQFYGLVSAAQRNNANGGLTLAGGDLDNDGIDELIVGQTNSLTSESQFHVIDVDSSGKIVERHPYAGFIPVNRGDGGIEIVTADLNGDGYKEIVVASKGNSKQHGGERDTAPLNLIGVIQPIVEENKITGFKRPENGCFSVFSEEANPSGALSIAAGELDGDRTNGEELVIGTGALVEVDGYDVTAIKPAPVPLYKIIKVNFDGDRVNGFTHLYDSEEGIAAYNSYIGDIYVAVMDLLGV